MTNGHSASVLGSVVTRYLELKRALGRQYFAESRILQSLEKFVRQSGSLDLTQETFASWCSTLEHLAAGVRRNHMRVVRNLSLYRRRTEPSCFVPDIALFPSSHQSVQPYIFSESEIAQLLGATHGLPRVWHLPIRPEVFRLAVVLLYTTGLRRRELLRLKIGDYEPREQTLLIRETKFYKSRYLPLSADAAQEVERYIKIRRVHKLPASSDTPIMWSGVDYERGYSGGGFSNVMRRLLKAAGISKHDGRPPRVHDFRHSFAVHALLRWYREGVDVQAKLPLLATYMGHVSVVSTQYYIQFVESLSAAASTLFEKRYGKLLAAVRGSDGGER